MIVNPKDYGWECLYQRAHAWMAYKLLLDFRPELRAQDWDAVLHAALTHDHGWMEWEEAQVSEEGEPCSFIEGTVDKSVRLCQRTVDLASYQSMEAAVLVARHVEELYSSREESALQECVKEIQCRRADWMTTLGWSLDRVEANYEHVLWADSASLILSVDEPEFVASLSLKIRDTEYSLRRAGDRWVLHPWPYFQDAISLSVDTVKVEKTHFRTAAQLQAALKNSERLRRTWVLVPSEFKS